MDEQNNIRQFLQGDADALCELVDVYRRPLYSFILHLTNGRDDTDEIFQEVWIKAIRALPRYQHRQRFSSWLFKIAHRTIIDRFRKTKPLFSFDTISDTLDQPDTADQYTPLKHLADNELGAEIATAVAALPADQREVFLLRMESDLSFKEIARIQHTSINTALARMAYARDKLRQHLEPIYKEIR